MAESILRVASNPTQGAPENRSERALGAALERETEQPFPDLKGCPLAVRVGHQELATRGEECIGRTQCLSEGPV